MIPDAVDADILVYDIETVAGGDCVDRTFWFTGTAVGALIGDTMCHFFSRFVMVRAFLNKAALAASQETGL
jgi:hypothetical protein